MVTLAIQGFSFYVQFNPSLTWAMISPCWSKSYLPPRPHRVTQNKFGAGSAPQALNISGWISLHSETFSEPPTLYLLTACRQVTVS